MKYKLGITIGPKAMDICNNDERINIHIVEIGFE